MLRLHSLRNYALLSLTLVVLMFGARCQAQIVYALKADVPFNFSAGNKTLPAGKYIVTFPSKYFMLLRNVQTNDSQSLLSFPAAANPNKPDARLVFRRYGHASFLTQVWTSANSDGRELGKSRSEKELIREMKSPQTAQVETALIPAFQSSR